VTNTDAHKTESYIFLTHCALPYRP
jgi:hypothetical protein